MSFRTLLDNTCTIRSKTLTSDGQGGFTETYTTLYTNIPCRFESKPRKLEILAMGGAKMVYPDFTIYIEARSNIRERDYVIFKGRTFEIKLVEDWSERGKYMSLHVVEIE